MARALAVPILVVLQLHGPLVLRSWWSGLNNSQVCQDTVYYLLCALYSLVGAFALIQLIRIEQRVPEYGWTSQKVFHLMNFVVNGVRALVFGFHQNLSSVHPAIFRIAFLDLSGLLYFSSYFLLVLFWAEIYHQARALPIDYLRPGFLIISGAIYLIQCLIWAVEYWSPGNVIQGIAKLFLAGVSFFAAVAFLLYGGRLFLMLRHFPIESKGRRNKLREVGLVTAICFCCFIIRCVVVATSAFDPDVDVNVLNHPILNLIFYMVVEILPSALILFILRKLPQKRVSGQYHPIR